MNSTNTMKPIAVSANEGEARWWLGGLAVIKTSAAETNGQLSIIEVTYPPEFQSPLHVHYREDEAFWILDGSATFEVGDQVIEAQAGDYLFGPRDIPHRFTVGPAGCQMLFILTPGGMEKLVTEMSVPAESRTIPPPFDEEPDWEQMAAIAYANGCELLP